MHWPTDPDDDDDDDDNDDVWANRIVGQFDSDRAGRHAQPLGCILLFWYITKHRFYVLFMYYRPADRPTDRPTNQQTTPAIHCSPFLYLTSSGVRGGAPRQGRVPSLATYKERIEGPTKLVGRPTSSLYLIKQI